MHKLEYPYKQIPLNNLKKNDAIKNITIIPNGDKKKGNILCK